MLDTPDFVYDAATAAAIGRRDLQEDAVAAHFPEGAGLGYVVLADGMGGQAAGDVASRIVVDEVLQEILPFAEDPAYLEHHAGAILRHAMDRANAEVARHATAWPALRGMGATLVAPLIVGGRLYWISVGDSPLYLLRGTRMARLNQDHSMADRLERMVQSGEISRQEAEQNPDRDCVTSVLFGAVVPEIDCRDRPLALEDGDILIAASDGLLFLDEPHIASVVHAARDLSSAEIGEILLREIRDRDDPDQDNVSLCVVKVSQRAQRAAASEAVCPDAPAVPMAASRPPVPMAPPRRAGAIRRTLVKLQVRRQGNRVTRNFSSESEG